MRIHYPSFLIFSIIMGLPSLTLLLGDKASVEAAQNCQALQKAKELIGWSDPEKALQKNTEGALPAVKEGLDRISQLLATKGIPGDIDVDVEMIKKHALELGFKPDYQIPNIEKVREFIKKAFPISEVALNDLRDFSPGKEVNKLLSDACQLLIPIEVDKNDKEVKPSTSITIRFIPDTQGEEDPQKAQKENGAGWRLTRWGMPKLIVQLAEQRQLRENNPGVKDFRLVSIPSLNRNFLGYEENNVLKLVPLFKSRHLTLGETYLAQDVFESLSIEAKIMSNSPR